MAAAGALGVVGVDRPAVDRRDRVGEVAALVQRVGVQRDLDVVVVGDSERAIDRRRRRAPVLVDLEPAGAGVQLLGQCLRAAAVALAEQADVDRKRRSGLEHPGEVPRARGAGGALGAVGGTGAAADQRRHAVCERVRDLLGGEEVDVRVDRARGGDEALAGDHLGARAYDQVGSTPSWT